MMNENTDISVDDATFIKSRNGDSIKWIRSKWTMGGFISCLISLTTAATLCAGLLMGDEGLQNLSKFLIWGSVIFNTMGIVLVCLCLAVIYEKTPSDIIGGKRFSNIISCGLKSQPIFQFYFHKIVSIVIIGFLAYYGWLGYAVGVALIIIIGSFLAFSFRISCREKYIATKEEYPDAVFPVKN